MDEQILKDFVGTAVKYNYDWNAVFNLFPELKNYDQQLLKDYTATAKKHNYDWNKTNSYFPEFGLSQQPAQQQQQVVQTKNQPTVFSTGETVERTPITASVQNKKKNKKNKSKK